MSKLINFLKQSEVNETLITQMEEIVTFIETNKINETTLLSTILNLSIPEITLPTNTVLKINKDSIQKKQQEIQANPQLPKENREEYSAALQKNLENLNSKIKKTKDSATKIIKEILQTYYQKLLEKAILDNDTSKINENATILFRLEFPIVLSIKKSFKIKKIIAAGKNKSVLTALAKELSKNSGIQTHRSDTGTILLSDLNKISLPFIENLNSSPSASKKSKTGAFLPSGTEKLSSTTLSHVDKCLDTLYEELDSKQDNSHANAASTISESTKKVSLKLLDTFSSQLDNVNIADIDATTFTNLKKSEVGSDDLRTLLDKLRFINTRLRNNTPKELSASLDEAINTLESEVKQNSQSDSIDFSSLSILLENLQEALADSEKNLIKQIQINEGLYKSEQQSSHLLKTYHKALNESQTREKALKAELAETKQSLESKKEEALDELNNYKQIEELLLKLATTEKKLEEETRLQEIAKGRARELEQQLEEQEELIGTISRQNENLLAAAEITSKPSEHHENEDDTALTPSELRNDPLENSPIRQSEIQQLTDTNELAQIEILYLTGKIEEYQHKMLRLEAEIEQLQNFTRDLTPKKFSDYKNSTHDWDYNFESDDNESDFDLEELTPFQKKFEDLQHQLQIKIDEVEKVKTELKTKTEEAQQLQLKKDDFDRLEAQRLATSQEQIAKLPTLEQLLQAQQDAHQANQSARQLQEEKETAHRELEDANKKLLAAQSRVTILQEQIAKLPTLEDFERVQQESQKARETAQQFKLGKEKSDGEKEEANLKATTAEAKHEHVDRLRQEAEAENIRRVKTHKQTLKEKEKLEQKVDALLKELDHIRHHLKETREQNERLESLNIHSLENPENEEPANNTNAGRIASMSANSANPRPQSPSTIRFTDEQNQGEIKMPAMKDSQPIVTDNSSLETLDDGSERGESKGLERNDSILSSSSGFSTGSTGSGEESTPTSSSESGGDNDTKHENKNKSETFTMSYRETCIKEIIAQIVEDKITAKKADPESLLNPLISTDLGGAVVKTILDTIISKLDRPEGEEKTTALIDFVNDTAQLSEEPIDRIVIKEKLLEQFNNIIDDCIEDEIQTASTNKNRQIVDILDSLKQENVTDKLVEIAKTAFASIAGNVQIQDLKPKVAKLVNFGQLESLKDQLKTQLEAMPISELDQLQANGMERLLTIENDSSTLTQKAKKIGDDAAQDQQEAKNKICTFFELKAQEIIESDAHKATVETLNINAENLANETLQNPAHLSFINELSQEVLTKLTDNRSNLLKSDTEISTLFSKKTTEIKSAIKSTLETLNAHQKEKKKIDQLFKTIDPEKVIETLTAQARTKLTQQLEANGYQADEGILTELQQSIRELNHRQFNAAKAKLRTALLERPRDLDSLSALSEEAIITALIHTKLESAPDKTLQTQADEAALKLSKQFMDHYKGATPVDLEKAYTDKLEAILFFSHRYAYEKQNITSRTLLHTIQAYEENLKQLQRDITRGELDREKNQWLSKINVRHLKLTSKEKTAYTNSIQLIEEIGKQRSKIESCLEYLVKEKTELSKDIEENTKGTDKMLVRVPSNIDYHTSFSTDDPEALNKAREAANTKLSAVNQSSVTYTDHQKIYQNIEFKDKQTVLLAKRSDKNTLAVKICNEGKEAKFYFDSVNGDTTYQRSSFPRWFKGDMKTYSQDPENVKFITQTILEYTQGKTATPTNTGGILTLNTAKPEWKLIYAEILYLETMYPEQSYPWLEWQGKMNFSEIEKIEKQVKERIDNEKNGKGNKQTTPNKCKDSVENKNIINSFVKKFEEEQASNQGRRVTPS